MKRDLPIGVFDSGLGGLTVLREISRRLPRESLVYLGDTARVPYGIKSETTILRYTREAVAELVHRGIKMLVVACNTASAVALEALRAELNVPVIGVIEPGAAAAVAKTRGRVGVIATEATIRSHAYRDAITAIAPETFVAETACPLFVPIVEEGWANTRVCREVAEAYLEPILDERIDTLVLACTHYPILRPTLRTVAGPGIEIVDSAEATAGRVELELRRRSLVSSFRAHEPTFLLTDDTRRFERIAATFLDHPPGRLELVELEPFTVICEAS